MSENPFVRYRERLDSYEVVRSGEMSDDEFVDIVERLDAGVEAAGGVSFGRTPMIDGSTLVAHLESDLRVSVKVDVGNVAGSHKARHLFGTALHMVTRNDVPDRLAIASCGNAALAAATVARALDRSIEVFVPTWADASVVARLDELGAKVQRCERREHEVGDPAYLRFKEAVADGAAPFSVQGTDTPTTFDGGRTLGWEIEEQLGMPDSVFVQVGGGALATSLALALPGTRLHPVQAEGCAPLAAAWNRLAPGFDWAAAEAAPGAYMQAWDDPHSLATGILDDVTYDWLPLLRATECSGGWPIVAPETQIERAWSLAHEVTDVPVCPTGTAGLAGLLSEPPPADEHVVVVFTGVQR